VHLDYYVDDPEEHGYTIRDLYTATTTTTTTQGGR